MTTPVFSSCRTLLMYDSGYTMICRMLHRPCLLRHYESIKLIILTQTHMIKNDERNNVDWDVEKSIFRIATVKDDAA